MTTPQTPRLTDGAYLKQLRERVTEIESAWFADDSQNAFERADILRLLIPAAETQKAETQADYQGLVDAAGAVVDDSHNTVRVKVLKDRLRKLGVE